jgi:MFS family permease
VLAAGLVPRRLGTGTGPLVVVLVLFFAAGVGSALTIPLNVTFVQTVPNAYRGRAFGVAVAGLFGVQGIGAVLAGLGAEVAAPSTVVAVVGGLGLIAVARPLLGLRRSRNDTTADVPTQATHGGGRDVPAARVPPDCAVEGPSRT